MVRFPISYAHIVSGRFCIFHGGLLFFMLTLLFSCNSSDKDQKRDGKNRRKANTDAPAPVPDFSAMNGYIQQWMQSEQPLPAGMRELPDLYMEQILQTHYEENAFEPVWVDTGRIKPPALDFMAYLDTAFYDGLFAEDYHYTTLKQDLDAIRRDSIPASRKMRLARADILFTDAFWRVLLDLKKGRLMADSLSWRHQPGKYNLFFGPKLAALKKGESCNAIFRELQPAWPQYDSIRQGIPAFLEKMDTGRYTWLKYPYNKGVAKDSLAFRDALRLRLIEEGYTELKKITEPDSAQQAGYIKQYQKKKGLEADGKPGPSLVRALNNTDRFKKVRIAISLDKLKQLPDSVPSSYIWVNIPAFHLQIWNSDTIHLYSKVVVGKPQTPTPSLTAAISNMVIYPTWTVPQSIIKKEMLPGLKRNPGYLARKGLGLYNYKGEPVDPHQINWSKYEKGIPYQIRQGSGDNNALGVIKFNFENPFDVYLHDTNQRYLFGRSQRALSHGCVRVQDWKGLAAWLVANDSLRLREGDSLTYNYDSITHWIAQKQKHRLPVQNQFPLYIRYITCEGKNGRLVFFDDIYLEDRKLYEQFLTGK